MNTITPKSLKKVTMSTVLVSVIIIAVLQIPVEYNKKQSVSIKIGVSQWAGYADIFVAQEKGFFEKNNVNVKIVFMPEYSKIQDLYKNGQTDRAR